MDSMSEERVSDVCENCDGDGYVEEWNDDFSGVITELCPVCTPMAREDA